MPTRCATVAAALVVCALARPAAAETPAEEPLEPQELEAGSELEAERELAAEPKPHYLRAAAELSLFLGAGTLWYHFGQEHDGGVVRPPWRERFTREVLRLDNNGYLINFVGHPLSGAAYYGFSRGNGMSMATSASYAFAASFLWEYVAELNDKISVNDLITTPVAGIATGEFFSRLALYLNRAPGGGSRVQRAFGWTLGFSQAVHDAMDRRRPPPAWVEADSLGYDASIAHRFTWRAGAAVARGDAGAFPLVDTAVEGRLVALPHYLYAGRGRRFFGDAEVTSMRLRVAAGSEGHGVEWDADTILLGLYAKRAPADASLVRSAAVLFGTSVGYLYRRDDFESFVDRIGTTRLPGLALDVDSLFRRVALSARARLHAEFAGVYADSFSAWRAAHPDERTKTALENDQYYYAWGLSAGLALRLEHPYFAIEGMVAHARYDSQEGLDRNQEEVTFDVEARDRVLDAEIALRVPIAPPLGFFVELGASRRERSSRVGEIERDRRLDRAYARFGQVF